MKRLALLLAVLALAACGGASTLTKAQYDAKVSRLCLVAADQFRELHPTYTIGDYQHDGAAIVRIGRHFDQALAALKPPSSIAAEAAVFVAANKKVWADEKNLLGAAQAGTPATFLPALGQLSHDNEATKQPARAIGATGCYVG